MNVARKAVQLGNCHRKAQRPRLGGRCRKLWPPVKRVAAFASLNLDKFADSCESLATGLANASRCASTPRPVRPCWLVLTRT